MSAKEKAEELFDKYFNIIDNSHPLTDIAVSAKQCALIAVDEIIDECYNWAGGPDNMDWQKKRWNYWQEIKEEIEKL